MRNPALPKSSTFLGSFLITTVAALLFLLSAAPAQAQQDEKDALIDAQRKQIERLLRKAELLKITVEELEAELKAARIQKQAVRIAKPGAESGLLPPPPGGLNGKIQKVDDGDQVEINLGVDDGLKKDQILDVYRINPEAKYLGKIRIVTVGFRTSTARLVPAGIAAVRLPFQVGDLVTSRLAEPEDQRPTKVNQPAKRPSAHEDARDVEIERLRGSNENLKASLKVLNENLLRVEAKQQEAARAAVTLEISLRALQNRNEQLLAQLGDAARKPIVNVEAITPTPPTRATPPQSAAARGIIEKVDSTDPTLVTLSIGGEAGVRTGHTLEVFRLKPTPKYLGTVRVLNVTAQKAVARWVRPPGTDLPEVQAGDEVAQTTGGESPRKIE